MSDEPIEIDIRPDVNILSVLRHLNYSPWFALAEFVDNSLASFLDARSRGVNDLELVTVSIKVESADEGRIVISDDAYGILAADFPRAFRAAEVPPDRSGLSEFGMGMKSAASWFARSWSVRTSVAGEVVQRTIKFDLDKILANNTHSLQATTAPARPEAHFTTVELRGLNHVPQGRTIGKIRSHLASIYRVYLRRGDLRIVLNGEPVVFNEVVVMNEPPAWNPDAESVLWTKSISVDLDGSRSVKGFAAIRETGNTSEAGFALFRRDRLIEGSFDDSYRPSEIFKKSNSFLYQRIFGELHFSGFDVSHTKDGFRWDEYEEELLNALQAELAEAPLNLIKQANDYRVAIPEADEREPVEAAASSVATVLEVGLPSAVDLAARKDLPDDFIADFLLGDEAPDDEPMLASNLPVSQVVRFNAEDGLWLVNIKVTLDDASPDWLQVGAQYEDETAGNSDSAHSLDVTVNFAHPFTRKYIGTSSENSELFLALASGIGMALALGKKSGARSQFVLSYLNLILNSSF